MSIGDLGQVQVAAERQLTEALGVTGRAAIATTSGETMLDFTDDVAKLRDTLLKIRSRTVTGSDCPDINYYMADLIRNRTDANAKQAAVQDTVACAHLDPQTGQLIAEDMVDFAVNRILGTGDRDMRIALRTLHDVVRRISGMPGQRSVVMISPGFLVFDQRFEMVEVLDSAIRANVTIGSLDARGLYTLVPGGDASQSSASIASLNVRTQYKQANAAAEGQVLGELAEGTGGMWIRNSNDLAGGLKRIAVPPEVYYVLGFSPENLKFDGAYHALKVSIKKPAGDGMTLLARRGYFAPKHEMNAAQEAKQEIEEAVFSRDEMHDIPVDLHTQFFKTSDVNARLSVLARIDIRSLRFRKADERNLNVLTVVSGIFDRNGNYVAGVEKTVNLHLKDNTLASKANGGITFRTPFDVAPGSYFVRLVVRDAEGQKMAAINGAVEIP